MKRERKRKIGLRLQSIDFGIFFSTLCLVCIGIVMVSSASYYWSIYLSGEPYLFLRAEIKWAILGILFLILGAMTDYRIYKKIMPLIILLSFILLIAVLVVGDKTKGARRWIRLGGFTLMPGEIAKLSLIIFTSSYLAHSNRNVNKPKNLSVISVIVIATGLLIMMQPNMSTAVTLVAVVFCIMIVAGLKWRYLAFLSIAGAAGGIFLALSSSYRLKRMMSFTNPFENPKGDGFQVVNSLFALGSGGLTGKGLGQSIQKNLFLPEPQNDFILAVIGEEIGYFGILVIILIYMFLIWRCIHVLLRCDDKFALLLGSGITMLIGIQVMLNLGIITSSIPPTGIALPFLSYGGNSLMLFCFSVGIMLNISRHASRTGEASLNTDGTVFHELGFEKIKLQKKIHRTVK